MLWLKLLVRVDGSKSTFIQGETVFAQSLFAVRMISHPQLENLFGIWACGNSEYKGSRDDVRGKHCFAFPRPDLYLPPSTSPRGRLAHKHRCQFQYEQQTPEESALYDLLVQHLGTSAEKERQTAIRARQRAFLEQEVGSLVHDVPEPGSPGSPFGAGSPFHPSNRGVEDGADLFQVGGVSEGAKAAKKQPVLPPGITRDGRIVGRTSGEFDKAQKIDKPELQKRYEDIKYGRLKWNDTTR